MQLFYLFCRYNRSTVKEGFKAIKSDQLDAFLYDATVLEFLVGQDDECDILTVGSWYAMTGKTATFFTVYVYRLLYIHKDINIIYTSTNVSCRDS